MDRREMQVRLGRLNRKLYIYTYALYDSLNRFGKTYNLLDKCRAYDRAIDYLVRRLY